MAAPYSTPPHGQSQSNPGCADTGRDDLLVKFGVPRLRDFRLDKPSIGMENLGSHLNIQQLNREMSNVQM
jgi:hypothetical protein